ncbi:MAG: site-2 protease family protein, partial [Candidatus Nanohaloarchaea archaeon]
MDASTLRLGFLIGMIALVFLLMYRDRENVERAGILFFRRTENGIEKIDRIAKKFPRFWNVYAWSGVIAALISIVLITFVVGNSVFGVASTGQPSSDFGLVAPGTGSDVSTNPGVTFVPAEYWFISIAVLMVVHELSHGIVARLEDFEINSVGVLVLGIIPGAFVEPKGENMLPDGDSEDKESESHGAWHQGDWISRIKVLSAGSFANYVFAVIFLIAATGTTAVLSSPSDIYYTSQEGFPAAEAGMTQGKLLSFNGSQVDNLTDFAESAGKVNVNDTLSLNTTEGFYEVTATSFE